MKHKLEKLLSDVSEAYEKSDIKKYCDENGHKWYYSLITTPLAAREPLVVGFNWGAKKGKPYGPQDKIENGSFGTSDVGTLKRVYPYLRQYFGSDLLSRTSQTNYCFFRSNTAKQITKSDIELCEPIFERLLEIIQPSLILCFSSVLRDYLLRNDKLTDKDSKYIKFRMGKREVVHESIRATLRSGIAIKFLPHSNYPMKKEARADAWKFCCKNR